jgi:hypothetical protein
LLYWKELFFILPFELVRHVFGIDCSNDACLAERQQSPILWSLFWPYQRLKPMIIIYYSNTRDEHATCTCMTITEDMLLIASHILGFPFDVTFLCEIPFSQNKSTIVYIYHKVHLQFINTHDRMFTSINIYK